MGPRGRLVSRSRAPMRMPFEAQYDDAVRTRASCFSVAAEEEEEEVEAAMRAEAEARSAIGRNVTAEEVAEAVAFLAGAEGITGQILFVDGGYSAVAGPVVR